ncbi:MAG TPA: hypothetical protein VFZ61_23185, partial [Polyangiales bacterium]
PPIALIGGDGRGTSELEALLKRGHPLITFPSLSHFLAEPAPREGWAAIVMTKASAWDVRLSRYVSGRRCIALFAQPEEGYGWPDDVTRLRELGDVDPWLQRLKEPELISVVKKAAPRAPRKPKQAAPTETPSWLSQDARVWNALASAGSQLPAEPAAPEPAAATARPASRRPPEQLTLGDLGGPAKRTQRPKATRQPAARAPRGGPKGEVRGSRQGKPERAAREQPLPGALPALTPQRLSELTRSLLKGLRPLSVREEAAFLMAAAEVGIVRADELMQELASRAARLA